MGATRLEAAEKTDAGRVAPISACVFYQIDRLKSGFEAMERTVVSGHCALMGATRPASVFSAASSHIGHFSAAPGRVAPISGRVWCLSLFVCLADSNNSNIATKEVGTHLRSNLLLLFYLEAILTNQRKLQGYYCSSLIFSPSSPSL